MREGTYVNVHALLEFLEGNAIALDERAEQSKKFYMKAIADFAEFYADGTEKMKVLANEEA